MSLNIHNNSEIDTYIHTHTLPLILHLPYIHTTINTCTSLSYILKAIHSNTYHLPYILTPIHSNTYHLPYIYTPMHSHTSSSIHRAVQSIWCGEGGTSSIPYCVTRLEIACAQKWWRGADAWQLYTPRMTCVLEWG